MVDANEHKPSDDLTRRQAVIPVTSEVMRYFLRLPEGFDVRGAHADYRMDGVAFVIRSGLFEETPDGAELPRVTIEYHTCDSCGGPVFDGLSSNEFGRVSW